MLRTTTSPIKTPPADVAEIARTLRLFGGPGQLGEVRIIPPDKSQSPRGFFFWHEEIDQAARLAAKHDPKSKGIYVVMNEIDPAILDGRKTLEILHSLTKDADITKRQFILIDFDPTSPDRGADDSSTDEEKTAAIELREVVYEYTCVGHTRWVTGKDLVEHFSRNAERKRA